MQMRSSPFRAEMEAEERRDASASDGDSDATRMSESDNDGALDSAEAELLIPPIANLAERNPTRQEAANSALVDLANADDNDDPNSDDEALRPPEDEEEPLGTTVFIALLPTSSRQAPPASSDSDSEANATPRKRRKRVRQGSTAPTKPTKPAVVVKPQPTECTVCYDPCTIAGSHRLVSLKCGHVFGKKCIDRWVAERRTCPNCSTAVRKADIRPLFTDHVAVVDNAGLEDMAQKFEAEKSRRIQLETDLSRVKLQLQLAQNEVSTLKDEASRWRKQVADLQCRIASERFKADADAAPTQLSQALTVSQYTVPRTQNLLTPVQREPSQMSEALSSPPLHHTPERQLLAAVSQPTQASHPPRASIRELFRYTLQSSRVCAISPSCGVLCIGEEFYPTSHGIIKLSTADTRHVARIPVHQAPIRDLSMSAHDDLVLSVSFDGKLCVSNLRSDSVVMSYALPPHKRNVWSCSFSYVDPFAMFCGFQDGTIARYDMRRPAPDGTALSLYEMPMRQPVHALQLCPTLGDSQEQLIAANFAGFGVWGSSQVATAATSVAVSHFTPAPGCCSLSSAPSRRSRLLVTTRSQASALTASHSVYDLPPSIVGASTPVLRSSVSGFRTPSVISRSAVWNTHGDRTMIASWDDELRAVNVWEEASQQVTARLPSPVLHGVQSTPVVDVKHATANGHRHRSGHSLLAVLSPKLLVLYSEKT